MRNGVKYTELKADNDSNPEISMTASAEIKMTFTGKFEQNPSINFFTDRLQPWLFMDDGKKYPLGKYIITDMQPYTTASGRALADYTAYDLCYLLSTSTTENRYFIEAGTRYTDAVQSLLIECGIQDFFITPSQEVLRTNREDWEPGTSRMEICNALLKEINYNSVYMDLQGNICCTPYRQASAQNIDHTYKADKFSLLYPETSQVLDYFNRANVFIRVVEDAETDEPIKAVSVNDDPSNAFSVPNQKRRVVDYDTLSNIANQEALQAYVDNLRFKSLLSTVETEFSTGPNPLHQPFSVVALEMEPQSGIYAETAWSMSLAPPWKMKHTGKKVVTI